MEIVKVFIKWKHNKIICICSFDKPKCSCKECEIDEVTHDKYRGIKDCFKQDKYGK